MTPSNEGRPPETRQGSDPDKAEAAEAGWPKWPWPGARHPGMAAPDRAGVRLQTGPSQSVEYFGWTFSPRILAMALLVAIAASPKPTEMSVIFPS
jgi:hypothetical protein